MRPMHTDTCAFYPHVCLFSAAAAAAAAAAAVVALDVRCFGTGGKD